MTNPIKSLLGQTAIYGVSSIFGRFINYLLVPFYTYTFINSEFGVVGELTAYVTIFVVLLTYGMETAFFRFAKNDLYKPDQVYSTALGSIFFSSALFIAFLVLFGKHVSEFIDYNSNPEYILLLGLTVAIDAFNSIPFARLRIENKARRFALIKIYNILINVFFNVFFLFLLPHFFGCTNFIYQILYDDINVGYIFISYFISSLMTMLILMPEIKSGFTGLRIDFKLLKQMLLYGFPILIAGLAGMFSESLDRILLKYLLVVPDEIFNNLQVLPNNVDIGLQTKKYVMGQLGIYTANVKIAVIMTLFLQAFRYAAEPFFFSYSKHVDSREIYGKVMKYFVAFSLFIFLGVTLFMDLVKYLISPDYRSGLIVVPMLLLSKVFIGIVFNLSIWYKLQNKTIFGALLALIGAFFSVGLNFILIPVFGIIGAAWASVISYFIMMVVAFILEKRNFSIPYDYASIGLYFTAALLFYALNYCARLLTEYYLILNFFLIFAFICLFLWKEKISWNLILSSLKKNENKN